jgi:probable rRNA maturation factor
MILNRQRRVRVARPALELFLQRVRRQLGLGQAEMAICLVSDAEIARMNESFRKKKGPTDVLSFPANRRSRPVRLPAAMVTPIGRRRRSNVAVASPERTDFLGDIAISPAMARRNAKKFGRALPAELQILILHGVLHLLGYDHETDRGQMQRVEHLLRRRLGLE